MERSILRKTLDNREVDGQVQLRSTEELYTKTEAIISIVKKEKAHLKNDGSPTG